MRWRGIYNLEGRTILQDELTSKSEFKRIGQGKRNQDDYKESWDPTKIATMETSTRRVSNLRTLQSLGM